MSVTTMLNATKKNDEWRTPPGVPGLLLHYLKRESYILCPFDRKDSAFVKEFKKAGHTVGYCHIDDGIDFFDLNRTDILTQDYIISNPPFSRRDEVFEHLFYLGIPFAMLMASTAGLFEGKRFNLFEDKEFEIMFIRPRICYIDQDGIVQKSPPFSSCYICHKVLPKPYVFTEYRKECK